MADLASRTHLSTTTATNKRTRNKATLDRNTAKVIHLKRLCCRQRLLPPSQQQQGPSPAELAAQNANRQARRLYVGNITYQTNEQNIVAFFNEQMLKLKLGTEPGEPAVSAQVNVDKGYAFVEFRHPEEATNAMSFDGIVFQAQSLKIRRPKDYTGPDVRPPSNIHVPGVISTNVPDSPHKIFVGGLPTYLSDDQVIELLQAFGELRAFNLVKDTATGASRALRSASTSIRRLPTSPARG